MIRSHKFDGYLKHLRNPDSPLTEVESAVVQSLIERRLEQIAKEHGRLRGGQPAEAIKKLRGDTTKIFTEAFPNFKNRRKQIADKYKPEFEKARARIASIIWDDLDLGFGGIANETVDHVTPPPPPLPAGIGEFWWDRTTFFSTLGEISVEQPDDEFIRIFGHLHWGGDSLLPGSVGFIQNFVLSPDRFPSTSETSFIIRSSLRNIGVISGFTGFYHPFWAADDKWCKCQWLVTARLFAPVGADSISQPAANTLHRAVSGTEVILDLDNESPVGQESKALPPIVGREVLFDRANLSTLSALGLSFVVQIENRFNIQLEGDADIWFTGNGGEPASRTPLVSRPHRSIWKPAYPIALIGGRKCRPTPCSSAAFNPAQTILLHTGRMSYHSTANVDPFLSTLPTAPWEAPDPLPVMRREMKLLLIELNLLRTEAQQLALANEEAEKARETLTASLNQTMASRDHWQHEAERLRELVASVPPSWLLWRRCLDACRAVLGKCDGPHGERQDRHLGSSKGSSSTLHC